MVEDATSFGLVSLQLRMSLNGALSVVWEMAVIFVLAHILGLWINLILCLMVTVIFP